MKPPITLVALDYQPVVIRTTAETIHINIGGEVRGLSDSTSGNWDLKRTAPSTLGEHLNGFPEAGRTQGSLTREVIIPGVLCLVDIAPHRVHEGVVVPLHLAVDRRLIRSGACLMNLEQLADSTEKLALEIPPLVRENLEGAPETREKLFDCCRGGNFSRLVGQGDAFHPLGELFHHQEDVLVAPCRTAQGSQKI